MSIHNMKCVGVTYNIHDIHYVPIVLLRKIICYSYYKNSRNTVIRTIAMCGYFT